jgi:hypothetical protein
MANLNIETLSGITTASSSDAVKVLPYKHHVIQYVVTGTTSNLVINPEGSADGDTFFELESSDVTKTQDGTYYLSYTNLPLAYLRFKVKTIAGTTPTVTPKFISSD